MILQALKDYYDRKSGDPDSGIAPPGWEWKEIHYIIVLDRNGNPVDIQSTVEGTGKTRKVKKFLVPQSVKRSSDAKSKSNLLWDNPAYVIGIPTTKRGKQDSKENFEKKKIEAAEKHAAFQKEIKDLGVPDDPGIIAVRKFLAFPLVEKIRKLEKFENWETLHNDGINLSFKLVGESGLVTDSDTVRSFKEASLEQTAAKGGICLVTGQRDSIEKIHPLIKRVWQAGTNIVSFNGDAFCSYGKEQGENAPVGKTAVFAYTTALNTLLGDDSKNRMQVGKALTVFWSEKPTALESNFPRFFTESPKDDPDRGIAAVKALFDSIKTGAFGHDDRAQRFYVLGLSPNKARIAIRFWIVSTVGEMEKNIARFFDDTEIVHDVKLPDRLSIFRLLSSTAVEGKSENIQPNLEGDFMRAILEGLPYPQTLLSAAIRRIRAEHKVTEHEQRRRDYTRAALIKACLNRSNHNPVSEELTVSLNLDNKNIGYRLGRLFAALEKIQAEANPGINATIRDRYYGAASGTPVTVFPNLMRLKNHHLSKLAAGRRIYFEQLLTEILSEIDDFPKNLSLEEQGRFAIGYYHQSEDLYKKKSDKMGTEEVKPTTEEAAESLF